MRKLKQILKSDAARAIMTRAITAYIRLVYRSGSWRQINADIPHRFWDKGEPFILAFWHGRLLMMPRLWPAEQTIHMLISQHRDGELITNAVAPFGIRTIRGSSRKAGKAESKGGAAALKGMARLLKSGAWVGITPDGPRGPRMRAGAGAVALARLSGVPIIPAAYSARPGTVARSWDRFLVPWPFTRGVVVWGEPLHVERSADGEALEAARAALEAGMNAIAEEADRLVGRAPVRPAEALPPPPASEPPVLGAARKTEPLGHG